MFRRKKYVILDINGEQVTLREGDTAKYDQPLNVDADSPNLNIAGRVHLVIEYVR